MTPSGWYLSNNASTAAASRYPRAQTHSLGRFDIAQVLEVPGIGQHVHIDDAVVAVFVYKQANDVRANKSGTAGDDDCHNCPFINT